VAARIKHSIGASPVSLHQNVDITGLELDSSHTKPGARSRPSISLQVHGAIAAWLRNRSICRLVMPARPRSVGTAIGHTPVQLRRATLVLTRGFDAMRTYRLLDKMMRCFSCKQTFILTAGEQELCELRGGRHSGACPRCVRHLRLQVCIAPSV
jgi:hypothetical protein